MAFTGKEKHTISLADAGKLTGNFRKKTTSGGAVLGHFFGAETIKKILAQEGCVGIRIYHAVQDDGVPTLVMVGVDANENDLVSGEIAEWPLPCPPFCGASNSLNS